MPSVPVPDLGVWDTWIGSIRLERLKRANLVLLVEEPSANPEILDAVHERLADDLSRLHHPAARPHLLDFAHQTNRVFLQLTSAARVAAV